MGGSLKPEQRAALEQLKEQQPVDAVPGFSVAKTGVTDPNSPWIKNMQRFSSDLATNAYAYNNFAVRKGKLKKTNRKAKRVISPDGFPSWISITYASPPPFSFWTPNNARDLTHFVLHSFGHMWHAGYSSKYQKYVGWMNRKGKKYGVQAYELDNRTVYVPTGSDPETLAHFQRFSAGLRACLNSAARATAHFFIDRAGNLVIVGDCNDILFTSNVLNNVSCGVELEEAFYVLKPTIEERAKWRAGGNPPGTAGNVQYAAFSTRQLYTLSVLVKKLELAYPKLKERNINFQRKVLRPGDPPGYTMHDFIFPGKNKNTGKVKSGHLDVSPQYLTEDLWNSFFKLVDSHTQINKSNIFLPSSKYQFNNSVLSTQPLSTTETTEMTERMLQYSQSLGLAKERVDTAVNVTKSSINANTASEAAQQSRQVAQKVASTIAITQQTQKPPADYPSVDIPYDDSGLQVGADDFL